MNWVNELRLLNEYILNEQDRPRNLTPDDFREFQAGQRAIVRELAKSEDKRVLAIALLLQAHGHSQLSAPDRGAGSGGVRCLKITHS